MRMGVPRLITSDNSKEFKNKLDTELSNEPGIRRIFTTPYHSYIDLYMYIHASVHIY